MHECFAKRKSFFYFRRFFFPSCLDKNLAISVIHGYIYGNDVVDIDLFFLVSCLFPFTFDWSGRNKLEKKKNKLIKWKFTFYREIFLFFRCSLMNSNSFFFFFLHSLRRPPRVSLPNKKTQEDICQIADAQISLHKLFFIIGSRLIYF